jgi:hypothetical protein
MEHRVLAALIMRIAGLLVIVSSVSKAAESIGPIFRPDLFEKVGISLLLLSIVVSVIIPIILGVVLIYFPRSVATKVLRIEGLDPASENELRPLQQVAFAAIGLWLTIYAILDAVYVYARARIYLRFFEDIPAHVKPPQITSDDFASLIMSGLQLLIGLVLLIGHRGIVNALAKLRA